MNGEFPEPVKRLEEVLSGIRARYPELAVQAIPWIRFKHPIHPTQMELAEGEEPRPRTTWGEWAFLPFRFLRCLFTAFHMTLQLAFLQYRLRSALTYFKKKRFELVAKTWAYPETLVPGQKDFYYGDLQLRLSEEGVRSLLLTGKPSEMEWRDFGKADAAESAPYQLPELCLVPLNAPAQSVFQQLPVSIRLLGETAAERDPFKRKVLFRAASDAMSPAVTAISLYYWVGREAARIWRPKAVLSLYEGYGWEDCLWKGVKEERPGCKTVGYQHTILLRHNLALLEPQPEGRKVSRPDLVLCLGPRTEEMLRASHRGCELFPFGTFRKVPSAARKEPSPERKTVVVVPTGYPDEATLLFDIAAQAARSLPAHRFILRSHPVLSFEQVLPLLKEDPSKLPNVEVSRTAPIEEDFARSSAALYRGSSSVLYGILYGLKPIFFSDGQFPDQDPLFEIDEWVERAASAEEVEERLRNYSIAEPKAAARQWEPAAAYAASYTVPAGKESIDQLLGWLKLKERESLLV